MGRYIEVTALSPSGAKARTTVNTDFIVLLRPYEKNGAGAILDVSGRGLVMIEESYESILRLLPSEDYRVNLDHLRGQWLPKDRTGMLRKQVELNQRADKDIDLSTGWSELSQHELAENIRKMIRREGGEKDE